MSVVGEASWAIVVALMVGDDEVSLNVGGA